MRNKPSGCKKLPVIIAACMMMSTGAPAAEPCTAEIRPDASGQPVLHINGEPSVFLAVKPVVGQGFYKTEPIIPMIAQSGIHLYNLEILHMAGHWTMEENSAFVGDEQRIAAVLEADPDAFFIVDVSFIPGFKWAGNTDNDPEKIGMYSLGQARRVKSSQGLKSNQWHHVVVTYNDSYLDIYIDGALAGRERCTGSLIPGGSLTIGGGFYQNETASPFLGILDEVKIYDRALSSAEVSQTQRNETGLLAHWNFENPDTIEDITGNGFDGISRSYQRAEGITGYGLLCTGPESVVEAPLWDSGLQVRTLEMWIKTGTLTSGYRHLFNSDQVSLRQEPLNFERGMIGSLEFFVRPAPGVTLYKNYDRHLTRPHPLSENANTEFSQRLQSWIPRLEAKYGDRIIGYWIHASFIGEWYYDCIWNGFVPGFDSWTEAGFQNFAMQRYQTIDAVNQAWGTSYASWDEISYPAMEERFSRDEKGEFFDPGTDRYLIDFFRSLNMHWGTMAKRFSTEIKDLTGRKKIVGLFHQYLLPASRTSTSESGAGLNHSGQLDTMSIIQHPDIDVIGAPPAGYFPWMFMGTPESIALHGKMPLLENDMKTHHSNWSRFVMEDLESTLASYRYCFEKLILPRRSAMWFYDIAAAGEEASLLRDPEVWDQIAHYNQLLQDGQANPVPYQPTAAIVFSEQTPFYMPSKTPVTEFIYDKAAKEMDQAFDTKVGSYLNEDFVEGRIQGADYIFVPSTFVVTPEERGKIHAFLRGSGSTVIWLYAPGYIDPEAHQASVSNITALTGIRVEALSSPVKDEIKPISGAPFGTGIADLRPQFYIPPQDNIRPLGVYSTQPENIAIAEKQMEGWRSIYCASPAISAEFIRSVRPSSSFLFSLIAKGPSEISVKWDGDNQVSASVNQGQTGAQTIGPGDTFTYNLPYSLTTPKFAPGVPAASYQGQKIYGGYYIRWHNGTASDQSVNALSSYAYRLNTNGYHQLDFTSGSNSNVTRELNVAVLFEINTPGSYRFDARSSLSLYAHRSSGGQGTRRWVVVADGVSYVAQTEVGDLTATRAQYTLDHPDAINWAVWTPGADVSFGTLTFIVPGSLLTNITMAGYAINRTLAAGEGAPRVEYFSGFKADRLILN